MNIYICILIMSSVTYIIRMLPLVLLRKPIKNVFFRSFLCYAPYVTLSVLTFPAILHCTENTLPSLIGFAAALITAFLSSNLPLTALSACFFVYITQHIF